MLNMTLKLPAKVSNEVAAGVSELYLRFNCKNINHCKECFTFANLTTLSEQLLI